MNRGFTLIELLIVITIIGILSVIFIPTVLNAPAKSRDAVRIADISNTIKAIEASRIDALALPATSRCLNNALPVATYSKYFSNGKIPLDPKSTNSPLGICGLTGRYTYQVYTGDIKYGVFARLEQTGKGNVNCSTLSNSAPPTLSDNSGDCYGALSL